jgi:hypothetical protein
LAFRESILKFCHFFFGFISCAQLDFRAWTGRSHKKRKMFGSFYYLAADKLALYTRRKKPPNWKAFCSRNLTWLLIFYDEQTADFDLLANKVGPADRKWPILPNGTSLLAAEGLVLFVLKLFLLTCVHSDGYLTQSTAHT